MAEELVFYTHPMSRGRTIRWMLEEIGQPYWTELLDYAGSMKAPAYLAVNPMGKVPAIKHGSTVVTEAAAICAYLADAFPQAGLAPPIGDPARGPYYRWLFFAAGPIEAAMMNQSFGWQLPPDKKAMAGYGSLPDVLDAMDGALNGVEYLAGGKFSACDLYVGSLLEFGMGFGMLEKRPNFERYVANLGARPARKRALEIDDALIPAKPAG